MGTIEENLLNIRGRVRDFARSAGRDPDEILIVAVSKTFGADRISSAFEAGQLHFGENYVQEFKGKYAALADLGLKWHFIGHLQSRKARDVVGRTHLIHSLDRLSLANELQKRAERADTVVDVLIEVHTTDEATKGGILPEDVPDFARQVCAFERLKVKGLMTMGPFSEDPEDARPCFARVRDLRETLQDQDLPGTSFDELSMGMTADFHIAIEEGATIVRIGTAIFGARTLHEQ